MSSAPPIVPSSNALRALRRLAYGGSTIIGAVGSVFMVAGVSYDTQRRVRLAEHLIETKRTIKSVSNSNGAAHVARMFEAAEKGEDFGLNITRSRRRNIKREYSALTTGTARQIIPLEAGPLGSYHPLVEDQIKDGELAKEASHSHKESVRPFQASTRNRGSVSSPQLAKRWPLNSPVPSQRQSVHGATRKIATQKDLTEPCGNAQVTTELPQTDSPAAGSTLVESYPMMRGMLGTTVSSRDILNGNLPHTFVPNKESGRNVAEEHSAVERILASTQQQHKLQDHAAHGRPGKYHVAKRVMADSPAHKIHCTSTNSSAAEKIVAATQQQHKVHSHTVYGRPGKATTEFHARLNEHVALWLSGARVSRHNSGLECDSKSQAALPPGGTIRLKRPGLTFPKDTSCLKPLRRSLSSSASKANESPPVGTQSSQQKGNQAIVAPANGSNVVTHIPNRDTQEVSEECPSYFQSTKDNQVSFCAKYKNKGLPFEKRYNSTGSEGLPRKYRAVQRSRKYSQDSFALSKEQPPAVETNKALQSDEPFILSSKQSTPPVALDLQLKPWPVTVFATVDILEPSGIDRFPPKNPQPEVTQIRQTQPSFINDISDQSSLHYDQNCGIKKDLSKENGEASFGSEKAFEEAIAACRVEGYVIWHVFLGAAIEARGKPAARQLWLNAMAYYATPGKTLDWKMVDDLHAHFHKRFWPTLPPYFDFDSARLLTRHFLETDPTSQRAAELLFPLRGKETGLEAEYAVKGMAYTAKQRSRNMFANASKYLQGLWDDGNDAENVVSELRKIIRVAKMQNVELAEDLFFGTIRRLSSNGQVEQAQALFDEMAYHHNIEPSFLTRSALVCGHARAGDWDRVATEIEAMHNVHDLSRREPLGYSLMFNDVLVEYASRRSIAQTHDFLVHALGYWGLVPTSAISATAIQAFLTHRRYDLVREWIETVRVLFPQVDTETSRFAWHLGNVFEDINASCVEVEEACKALCYHRDASKMQPSLREMVRLALARDLATKLHAAEVAEAGSQKKDNFPAESPWALNHFLERAQSFAPDASTEGEAGSSQSQEVRELLSQVESVARLDNLFGTKWKYTDLQSTNINRSSQPRRFENKIGQAQTASLQSHVPTGLMYDLLPTFPEAERLLNQYYSTRQDEGLPISHAILQYTCQKLRKHDRRVDAMQLLKATFDGPYVQGPKGVMLELPIMEMWLRFAYEAKSLSHCLTVFWAVLDAGEDYILTSKFVLLANMSYHRVRQNRFDALARTNPSKHEELEYLLERLRRRLWADKEGSGPKTDKSRGAEYRKMKQKMRRRLVVGTQRTVEVSG